MKRPGKGGAAGDNQCHADADRAARGRARPEARHQGPRKRTDGGRVEGDNPVWSSRPEVDAESLTGDLGRQIVVTKEQVAAQSGGGGGHSPGEATAETRPERARRKGERHREGRGEQAPAAGALDSLEPAIPEDFAAGERAERDLTVEVDGGRQREEREPEERSPVAAAGERRQPCNRQERDHRRFEPKAESFGGRDGDAGGREDEKDAGARRQRPLAGSSKNWVFDEGDRLAGEHPSGERRDEIEKKETYVGESAMPGRHRPALGLERSAGETVNRDLGDRRREEEIGKDGDALAPGHRLRSARARRGPLGHEPRSIARCAGVQTSAPRREPSAATKAAHRHSESTAGARCAKHSAAATKRPFAPAPALPPPAHQPKRRRHGDSTTEERPSTGRRPGKDLRPVSAHSALSPAATYERRHSDSATEERPPRGGGRGRPPPSLRALRP